MYARNAPLIPTDFLPLTPAIAHILLAARGPGPARLRDHAGGRADHRRQRPDGPGHALRHHQAHDRQRPARGGRRAARSGAGRRAAALLPRRPPWAARCSRRKRRGWPRWSAPRGRSGCARDDRAGPRARCMRHCSTLYPPACAASTARTCGSARATALARARRRGRSAPPRRSRRQRPARVGAPSERNLA